MVSSGSLPDALKRSPVVVQSGQFEVRQLSRLPRAWMQGPGEVQVCPGRTRNPPQGHRERAQQPAFDWVWPRTMHGAPTTARRWAASHLHQAERTDLPGARRGELVLRYHPPGSQWVGLALTCWAWPRSRPGAGSRGSGLGRGRSCRRRLPSRARPPERQRAGGSSAAKGRPTLSQQALSAPRPRGR